MKANKTINLGDKSVNYPDTRKSVKGRKNFPWVSLPIGRTAKILIMLIGSKVVEVGETVDRNFRDAGLTKEELYAELTRLMPWFQKYFKSITMGSILTPHIVRQRFYMMYLNGTSKGECHAVSMGEEHPLNNTKLRSLVPNVEKLFKRNTTISAYDAFQAGEYFEN